MIKCERCDREIHFAKTGVNSYKWVTNPAKPKTSWKCDPTMEYPVRSHAPKQEQDNEAPHVD